MANNCFYCSKEISENIRLCSSCESFISMLKDEGIINDVDMYLKNGIHVPEFDQVIRFILSREWSCERCGYIFNREILELLKLAKNPHITEEQEKDCLNMLVCPKCSFTNFSKMWEYYNKIIRKRTIRDQRYREKEREERRKSFEKSWKAYYEKTQTDITKNQNKFIYYQNKFNPLKELEPMEIDYYSILLDYDSFRTRKLEWIDYFGIIIKKNQQIYSNIEQGYLDDQIKLDRIAESFVSGTLHEKLSQIYSPYLKKYEDFEFPNVYSREKDDILYIIIGKFRSTRRAKLILNKIEIFIENLKFKKIVDVENLDKSGIVMVQNLMEIFIFVMKCYFFANNRKAKKLLLSKLTNFIYILNNDFIYWQK